MTRKGAIWVSTVLYILISLAIIALVLVSVQPVINKNTDKAIIEQSKQVLDSLDETIDKVSNLGEGTQFEVEITIKKGQLIIDSEENFVSWLLEDSSYMYSEPNQEIVLEGGKKTIQTLKNNDKWKVIFTYKYPNLDLESSLLPLKPAENPYNLLVKNKGKTSPDENKIIQIFEG